MNINYIEFFIYKILKTIMGKCNINKIAEINKMNN